DANVIVKIALLEFIRIDEGTASRTADRPIFDGKTTRDIHVVSDVAKLVNKSSRVSDHLARSHGILYRPSVSARVLAQARRTCHKHSLPPLLHFLERENPFIFARRLICVPFSEGLALLLFPLLFFLFLHCNFFLSERGIVLGCPRSLGIVSVGRLDGVNIMM